MSRDEMGKCDGCSSRAAFEDWATGFCHRWCAACLAIVTEVRDRPERQARARGAFMALGMVGLAVAGGMLATYVYLVNDSVNIDPRYHAQGHGGDDPGLCADALASLVNTPTPRARPREGCE